VAVAEEDIKCGTVYSVYEKFWKYLKEKRRLLPEEKICCAASRQWKDHKNKKLKRKTFQFDSRSA
jgi:hypothetical protein